MSKIIKKDFFNRYTPKVARDLLGCFLLRKYQGRIFRAIITETEAYRGEHDLACHASKGRTARTETLYAKPGTVYVYLIYGMYWMLNIVTEQKDYPAAVLIRAVSGVQEYDFKNKKWAELGDVRLNKRVLQSKQCKTSGQIKVKEAVKRNDLVRATDTVKLNGPGKLTKFLQIDKTLNGHDVTKGEKLWLEFPVTKKRLKIIATARIGVDYAKHCKEWEWNYKLEK